MTGLARDLRYGIRMLAKNPGLSLAAVLAFALGIGLSTAMFSIVYGVIFRGLPFEEPEQLLHIENNNPSKDQQSLEVFLPDYLELRKRQKSFEDLAAFSEGTLNLSGDEKPERYEGAFVTANTFDLVRVKPLLGRGILRGEDSPQAEPVVILGYGLWHARYNADPKVIGRKVRINGDLGTIVGVMPEGFAFPIAHQVWVPLRLDPLKNVRGRGETLEVFGRLKDGISIDQARAELGGIMQGLAKEFPETNKGVGAVVKPYTDEYIGEEPRALLVTMLGACLAVLLLACVNVASLVMSRASKRTREIAIRSSLGADRRRLIGQLLTESVLLSLVGALLGVLLAYVGIKAFNAAIAQADPPFWLKIAIDPAALLFALGATLLAGIVSGLVPAFQASRTDVNEVLKDEGRGSSSLRMGVFTRIVVILEVGISCLLLVGAGLMIQNVLKMGDRVEVDTANLFTARIALFESAYPEEAKRARFFETLLTRLREDPAVVSAAASTYLPAAGTWAPHIALEGATYPTKEDQPRAHIAWISSEFVRTFNAEVLRGRDFDARDTAASLPVALVNSSFVKKFWPGQDPIGRRIRFTDADDPAAEPWRTVIGVVPDLGMAEIDDIGDEFGPEGFYFPLTQDCPGFVSVAVRTRDANPLAITEKVRAHVTALDKDLPIYFVRSMEEVVAQTGFFQNLFATLFAIFGLVALVLASVGIYGVIAFSVEQRTQEIGIRMALGARQSSVLGLILRQGMVQLLIGLGLGLLMAWPAAKLLGNILVGVQPHDPPTFVGVCLLLASVALLACWIPAQRASRTDPLVAIRYD
ncbi:MAG: putative transport system permease protein [Acidobacteriota bacterium]|jgi:predicted permease|nr:putative transport system permease protein [Acidobacteriota bacterium]